MANSLTREQARRLALSAQGFTDLRPTGTVDRRHGRRVFDRVGLIQVDSVNVLTRSQELPLFARLGGHRRDLIPMMLNAGELFEYWGHEASLIPVDQHHLFRWKMEAARTGQTWPGIARLQREQPGFVQGILEEVEARGPLSAGELSMGSKKQGPWWGWGDGKMALEYLFWSGDLTARRRAGNFEREYAVPSAVIPPHVLARPTPTEHQARKELLMRAARAMGVATAKDLADYHRQRPTVIRPLLAELVEAAVLLPVEVEGWKDAAYLDPTAKIPRRVDARAVLSPFDSLVWNRDRAERLFDFQYRIEIYVPQPKRVYGYYVLPFLLGDRLAGRVDLKADRHAGVLRVPGAHIEPGWSPIEVAEALAAELHLMAAWLGLSDVVVGHHGALVPALIDAVRRHS